MESAICEEVSPREALDRLFERLSRQPDFSALQASVRRVQSVVGNETARLQALVDVIADDPAITGRLLRLINAAHYRGVGGGDISSIQRAVLVMGFNAVRNLVVTLRLLDRVPTDRKARILREDFLRSLLAARLAHELAWDQAHPEELYIAALFQNLGRMLLAAHLPDDALAIRDTVSRQSWSLSDCEDAAARTMLAIGHSEIGQEVARMWGWPESVRLSMRRDDWPTQRPESRSETLRVVGKLANELSDLMVYWHPEAWPSKCEQIESYASRATGMRERDMIRAMAHVRQDLEDLTELVGLPLSQLLEWRRTDVVDGLPDPVPPRKPMVVPSSQASSALMAAHAQEISEMLATDTDVDAIPARSLTAIFAGLGAQRGVLFLSKGGTSPMVPVSVVGAPLQSQKKGAKPPWQVDPHQGHDLFSKLCARGADTLINHAHQPEISAHLPPAFACAGSPDSFFIMPLTLRKRPVGMIYLDRADGQLFDLTEERMQLLRTLRNQALMALK